MLLTYVSNTHLRTSSPRSSNFDARETSVAKICRIIPLRTPYNVSVNSVDQGDNSGEEMVD